MCFDLETGKVVLRRTITILPMPDPVISSINDWGKSQKNAGFKNKLELWDRMKNKYDWENEDLDVSDGKFEVEAVNTYPHIYAEIPGVLMESDLHPAIGGYEEGGVIDIAKVEEEVLVGGSL